MTTDYDKQAKQLQSVAEDAVVGAPLRPRGSVGSDTLQHSLDLVEKKAVGPGESHVNSAEQLPQLHGSQGFGQVFDHL